MNAQAENTERSNALLKEVVKNDEWIRDGIFINLEGGITADSTHPRAIPITAINSLTGEVKHYMLRVTSKGGLCLV